MAALSRGSADDAVLPRGRRVQPPGQLGAMSITPLQISALGRASRSTDDGDRLSVPTAIVPLSGLATGPSVGLGQVSQLLALGSG